MSSPWSIASVAGVAVRMFPPWSVASVAGGADHDVPSVVSCFSCRWCSQDVQEKTGVSSLLVI